MEDKFDKILKKIRKDKKEEKKRTEKEFDEWRIQFRKVREKKEAVYKEIYKELKPDIILLVKNIKKISDLSKIEMNDGSFVGSQGMWLLEVQVPIEVTERFELPKHGYANFDIRLLENEESEPSKNDFELTYAEHWTQLYREKYKRNGQFLEKCFKSMGDYLLDDNIILKKL